MSADMFMKIDNIEGESADDAHAGEIDIISWEWGMTQSGTTHMGRGGGSGKVNVKNLTFTHYIDKSTPRLMKMCCSGKHFEEATLVVRKAGNVPLEYMIIKLKQGIISSVDTGGSVEKGKDKERLTEEVTLNFSEFNCEYVPQKEDGSGDASIIVGWNIANNVDAS